MSIFDSLKSTFNKPNVSRFVNNAARTYFTKIDPVGRAVNQGVQLARFAQAKRPDQFIKNEVVKPITKRIAQSGVAIGDIVERSNPAINAYHGLRPFVQNIGQPNYMNKVAQGQLQGIARPLNYERIYNKNVMNPADAREFIGRAVEAPTYLYSGTKGLGSLQGNLGSRVLRRTTQVLPEAGLQTIIDTGVEGDIRKAPGLLAQNVAGMALLSNAGGLYGDFVRKGGQVGASIKSGGDNVSKAVNEMSGNIKKIDDIIKAKNKEIKSYGIPNTTQKITIRKLNEEIADLESKKVTYRGILDDLYGKGGQLGMSTKNLPPEPKKPTGKVDVRTKNIADFQEKVIAGQDLGKEIGKKVNPDGTITLYHGTSRQNADNILKGGSFNDGTYFSVNKGGTQYGDSPLDVAKRKFGKDATVIEVKVDARGLESAAAGSEVFSPGKLVKNADGTWSLSQPTGAKDTIPEVLRPRKGGSVGVKTVEDATPKFLKDGIKFEQPQKLSLEDINRIDSRAQIADTKNKQIKNLIGEWLGKQRSGGVDATTKASKYVDIKANKGFEVIRGLEGKKVSPDIKAEVPRLRKAFDQARKDVMDLDKRIDIGYIKDYATHIWRETDQGIIDKATKGGLADKLKFSKGRVIADYDTGVKLGLTPKYKQPAELLEAYYKEGYKIKANLDFYDKLKAEGLVVPKTIGKNSPGYSFVNVPGLDGGGFYAPKNTAEMIQRTFMQDEIGGAIGKTLDITSKVAKTGQQITLSGGVPKTPINFFGLGAVYQKELLSGRGLSGATSLLQSSTGQKNAIKWFSKPENLDVLKKFNEAGLNVSTPYKASNMIPGNQLQKLKDALSQKSFKQLKEIGAQEFHKAIDDPTFNVYMPMLMIKNFKRDSARLVKQGMKQVDADALAMKMTKEFYNPQKFIDDALQSKTGRDIISTLFFAPKYRKGLFGWYKNVGKSVIHPLAKESRRNQFAILGMIASVAAADKLNQELNGVHLWDNPRGKEDKVLIPLGDKTIGLPVLPSLSTLPRMIGKVGLRVAEGDIGGAISESFRSAASMPIKTGAEIAANEDYFGNEIVSEFDSPGSKLLKQGAYVAKGFTHPYIKGPIDKLTTDKPNYQIASEMAELPIRFYNTKSIKDAPIWEQYENQKKIGEIEGAIKSGKLSQEQGQKQIEKISGSKIGKNQLLTTTKNGSFVYSDNDGRINFADSQQEAELAIKKSEFKASDKNFLDLGDIVLRKSTSGNVTPQDKEVYNDSLYYQQLNSYKKSGDMDKWMATAEKKLANLDVLINDPNTDPLDRITYENRKNTLIEQAKKYASYGGFKKGRSGGSSSKGKIAIKTTSPKSPSIKSPKNIASVALKGGSSGRKTVKLQTRKGNKNRELYG